LPEVAKYRKIWIMKEDVDLSICIVTWNSENDIAECLSSIEHAKKNLNIEVFVADNASSDNTAKIVSTSFPEIILIQNSKNYGFAKANNQAIRRSSGRYVLLLNPDTRVRKCTFKDAIDYMEVRSKIGIVGCAISNLDGSRQYSVRKFPSLTSQILILCKLHNFFPSLPPLKKYFALDFDYAKEQSVDQVMGAFMLIRRKCLEQVGLLDEKFWIWFEDVDYCKRAINLNWKVMYTPKFEIAHNQSQSFAKLWAVQEQRVFNKSLLYYIRKHRGNLSYRVLLIFVPISIILSTIVGIFEPKTSKIKVQ